MSAPDRLKIALAATPECLSLKQLEDLAANPVPNHPHVSQCVRCQAEVALLKQFEADEPLPDEGAAVAWINARLESRLSEIKSEARQSPFRAGSWLHRLLPQQRLWKFVPVAAAMAIAIGAAILLYPKKEPDLRAGLDTSAPVFRSQEVELLGASGAVSQTPTTLEWKAFPGASRYKVSIMEVDHSVLWDVETSTTSVTIPQATRDKMLASKPILWQVVALDLQGKVLASSQSHRFVVSPKVTGVSN